MSGSPGFLDESTRCRECGMMPPDHDPVCPNNPAFHTEVDTVALKEMLAELETKLDQLERAPDPNFEAISELIAKIESMRSYIKDVS